MACINTYSQQEHHHQGGAAIPMSPRISFSNDFVVVDGGAAPAKQQRHLEPADPNFEFAVGGRPMMAADELIFKGRLLPLRESRGGAKTLRDELLAGDEDDEEGNYGGGEFSWSAATPPRASKGPARWKEMFGLRKPAADAINGGSSSSSSSSSSPAFHHYKHHKQHASMDEMSFKEVQRRGGGGGGMDFEF